LEGTLNWEKNLNGKKLKEKFRKNMRNFFPRINLNPEKNITVVQGFHQKIFSLRPDGIKNFSSLLKMITSKIFQRTD